MQQPQSNHTQPMQFSNPQYQPVQPSLMMCPVQYVYDPQMMVTPDEQARPTPNRTFQNQAFLFNVQNTPPWVQQQPNMVYMPQMQMTNNIQPYIPQQMIQNPMYQYQYQPMIMQERMRLPNYVNQNLIQNPQMVQHVMQNPQMIQNPQMMQNSQMVQNSQLVQNVMQNSQGVQNGMQNSQMVQNVMQNPQMVNGMQNPQIMLQNGMQNPQTLVQNPQNLVNRQNLIQSPVIFQQVEQKRDSPRPTPILQNQVNQPTNQNEIISPIIIKPQYQNVQPQMIIMNPIQKPHTCTNNQKKELPPVIIEKPKDEVPQHIRSQIPEGLSVKSINKAATALVKPTTLPNIAPVDESHPRVYPKPVVKPVSNRDPQTNYKRKIQEMAEQNNKDASEVETFKRECLITKQEVVNKNNRVKIFFEIPDAAMLQNNINNGQVNRQNTQNGVNRPAEDKLLRNTVYVQARGRVNEKINEAQNMSAEGNQIIMGTNNGLPIWQNNNMVQVNVPVQTERVLNDQVLPYNSLLQQKALVIYTENTSQTDEVKKKKPSFILKYDVGTATDNFQKNIRIAPSNYGDSKEIIKPNTQSETIKLSKNAEHDDTTMQNNSTMSRNLLSNDADCVKNSKDKEITISRADDGTPRKKLKITKRSHNDAESNHETNTSKKLKTIHTVKNKEKPETKEIYNAKVKNINKPIIGAYVPTRVLDEHIIQESDAEKSQTKKMDGVHVQNIKTPIETHVPDGNIIQESNGEKKKEKSQTKKMESEQVQNIKTPIETQVQDGNIIQESNGEKKNEKSQTKKTNGAQVQNIKTPIATHVPDGNIIQESNVERKKEKSQTKKVDGAKVKNKNTPIETYVLTHVLDGHIIRESNVKYNNMKEKSPTKKMDCAKIKSTYKQIDTYVPTLILDGHIIQESNVDKKKEKYEIKKMDNSKVKNINKQIESYVPNGHIIQESDVEKKKEKYETKKVDSVKVKNANTPTEPYVLTHVLDGHVIQESNVPFVIQRPTITFKIPPKETKTVQSEARPSYKETIVSVREDSNSSSIEVVDVTPDSTGTEPDTIEEILETTYIDVESDIADSGKIDNTNEDDPFKHLSEATVKSWSVSDLITHLMKHEDWQETAQELEEQEVDGESLFLANEEQLICIGICEEHVKIISKFLERNRGKTT